FSGVTISNSRQGADMAPRSKSAKPITSGKRKPRASNRAKPQIAAGPRGIYVISDSTGNLPRHMLGAFMTQFPRQALNVRFESFVRTAARLQEILDLARVEK